MKNTKKIVYIISIFLLLTFTTASADLFISEVADPGDVYQARFIELYNTGSAIDFDTDTWYLCRQSNGGSTWGDILLTGIIGVNATFCIAYNATYFETNYGFAPDQESGNINGNGDDGYFLYSGAGHSTGTLVDAYGVIDEDGTGKPWEYKDAIAYRKSTISSPNTTWTASEWTIIDPGNTSDATPGSHTCGGPEPLTISNISRQHKVPTASDTCWVRCDITGGTSPYDAKIKYNVDGTPQTDIVMDSTGGDTYQGTLPAQSDGIIVEYYIKVTDSGKATDSTSTSGLFWGTSDISNAAGKIKAVDANGALLYEDYYARVTGVATVASGVYSSSSLEVYLQDSYGGINLYKGGAGTVTITAGNSYTVFGVLDQYNGKAQLKPDDASTDITDNGAGTMPNVTIKTIAQFLADPETYEGMLIGIQHVSNTGNGDVWPSSGNNANVEIDDGGSDTMILRVDRDTDLDENTEPAWPKDVAGIASQYDYSSPYNSGYQIIPRAYSDIWADGTLPVVLSTFTAEFLNNVPTLYWTTESETDNIGWNVYRNTENNFSTATKITSDLINGYGTTSEPHSYIYEDYIENAEPGDIYWYWLENVDLGGETHHYNSVACVEISDGSQPSPPVAPILYEIKNSPNPFNPDINERTKISFTLSDAAFAKITIYNIRGEKVKTLPLVVTSPDEERYSYWNGRDENGKMQASGIYLYELKVNGKIFSTQRLIVIR